jgi:hypothetical protein
MDSIGVRHAVSKGVKDSHRLPALRACYPRNGLHPSHCGDSWGVHVPPRVGGGRGLHVGIVSDALHPMPSPFPPQILLNFHDALSPPLNSCPHHAMAASPQCYPLNICRPPQETRRKRQIKKKITKLQNILWVASPNPVDRPAWGWPPMERGGGVRSGR